MKIKRKVYHGWMNVKDPSELPKKVCEVTTIKFGSSKWFDNDPNEKEVTITVEWRDLS